MSIFNILGVLPLLTDIDRRLLTLNIFILLYCSFYLFNPRNAGKFCCQNFYQVIKTFTILALLLYINKQKVKEEKQKIITLKNQKQIPYLDISFTKISKLSSSIESNNTVYFSITDE